MAAFINPSIGARPGHIVSYLSRYITLRYLARVHPDFLQVGGNMPGRGLGERLAVDPKLPNIIYFGARSGNGLWKCERSFHFTLFSPFLNLRMASYRLWSDLVQGH